MNTLQQHGAEHFSAAIFDSCEHGVHLCRLGSAKTFAIATDGYDSLLGVCSPLSPFFFLHTCTLLTWPLGREHACFLCAQADSGIL